MNPMQMLQLKNMMERFQNNHPRVLPFLHDAGSRVQAGTVIEMKVTTPDGHTLCSNIRVTEDDMELVRQVRSMG